MRGIAILNNENKYKHNNNKISNKTSIKPSYILYLIIKNIIKYEYSNQCRKFKTLLLDVESTYLNKHLFIYFVYNYLINIQA